MNRICKNCGAKLQDNDIYCPVCGIKTENTVSIKAERRCRFCGAELPEDAVFCSECGREQNTSTPYVNVPNKKAEVSENGGVNPVILGAMIGGGVVLIAAVVILVVLIGGRAGKHKTENDIAETYKVEQTETVSTVSPTMNAGVIERTPEPIPILARTPAPVTTPVPAQNEIPQVSTERSNNNDVPPQSGYHTYTDSDYSFSCKYPASFRLTVVESNFYRYTLSSPDGVGSLYICATSNNNGRTPVKVLDNFMASYGGSVDYQNSGSDWCAIRTLSNGRYHYGYFKLTNGLIRGFEMHFPSSQFDLYDGYINDIYSSIEYY